MHIRSKVVHGCKGTDEKTGAVSFPIYQSATFKHPGLNESTGYDYSRLQNPTREEVEATMAILEEGERCFAFSSGMAGISTVFKLFAPGDHIIISDDLYGGTYRICEEIYKRYGISYTYVDTSYSERVEAAVLENTKAIFVETPTNPMMKITDIKKMSKIAKTIGAILIVDNTFLTPYLQKPILLGADIVVHSGTKYLGGHNDVLAGFVIVKGGYLVQEIELIQKSEGAVLSPFDSWLVLRGIKTLAIRLDRQEENASKIAKWLQAHEKVNKVYYAGLLGHQGYDIMQAQAKGFGAMISFEVTDVALVEKILGNVKLIYFAESLGGVETLITYPLTQTHNAIPQEIRERIGINNRLLRLSVGIEDVDDIIADLAQAMG